MNETKSVKALKKQMAAAIAMVCVAAVALGSSTYAWFVTNNKVDATSSSISAQSNAAFMYIRDEKETSTDLTSDDSSVDSKALYPAHWALTSEKTTYADAGNFYKAYAQGVGAAAMDSNTLAKITDTKGTEKEGTPAAAVASDYAVKNTFYVGTKGTNLTNLIVDNNTTGNIAIVDKSAKSNANAEFDDALRILVTCGDNWVLCDKNSILGASNTENKLADTVTAGTEQKIEIYVFYDGDSTKIYTNNLEHLTTASKNIKVTFTATPANS